MQATAADRWAACGGAARAGRNTCRVTRGSRVSVQRQGCSREARQRGKGVEGANNPGCLAEPGSPPTLPAPRCSRVLECYIPRPALPSQPTCASSPPLHYPLYYPPFPLTTLPLSPSFPSLNPESRQCFPTPSPALPRRPASSLHSMRVETLIIPLRVLLLPPSAPQVILHPLRSSLFSLQVILSLPPSLSPVRAVIWKEGVAGITSLPGRVANLNPMFAYVYST